MSKSFFIEALLEPDAKKSPHPGFLSDCEEAVFLQSLPSEAMASLGCHFPHPVLFCDPAASHRPPLSHMGPMPLAEAAPALFSMAQMPPGNSMPPGGVNPNAGLLQQLAYPPEWYQNYVLPRFLDNGGEF